MASKKQVSLWGIVAGIVAILFFVGSLILVNPSNLYISPDETANAYFASQLAQTGQLIGETNPLSAELGERIHPRSTVSVEGTVLPGSFLGLPLLYGMIASLLGIWVLPFITPLLTLLTAYAFRQVVSRFTSKIVGNISFILFLMHPAVWYYSARGLMHNVLFVDVLILAAWLWLDQPLRRKKKQSSFLNDGVAGLLVALAVFVRTSEVAWVAAVVFVTVALAWKAMANKRLRVATIGALLGGGIALLANHFTYGHPFLTGYTVGAVAPEATAITETVATTGVLPFGFHPRTALEHFVDYGVIMFWWLSLMAAPGCYLLWSQKRHQKTVRAFLIVATVISIWLVLMYGSWEIHDNPDPTQVTMANSYVRYWLPMYLVSVPLIALTIQWISKQTKTRVAKRLITATLLLAIIGLNVHATFIQGQDGLLKVRDELEQSAQIQERVLQHVPEGSIIIVDRSDKLFFPHRDVWYPLRDEATYDAMPTLEEAGSLFYYGITFPETDLEYLNNVKLAERGLQIIQIESFDIESLYQITQP